MGGSGTGDLTIDEKLAKAYAQGGGKFFKLAKKGFVPSDFNIDTLCPAPTDDWDALNTCAIELASDVSIAVFGLRFDPTPRAVSDEENDCRHALGNRYATLYRTLLRNRVKCFKKSGLLGDGSFSEFFDCRSPVVPVTSYGIPDTGLPKTDQRIRHALNAFQDIVHEECPGLFNGLSFPTPLSDPTGGIFGAVDQGRSLATPSLLARRYFDGSSLRRHRPLRRRRRAGTGTVRRRQLQQLRRLRLQLHAHGLRLRQRRGLRQPGRGMRRRQHDRR